MHQVLDNWPTGPVDVSEDTGLTTELLTVSATDGDSDNATSGQLAYTITGGSVKIVSCVRHLIYK